MLCASLDLRAKMINKLTLERDGFLLDIKIVGQATADKLDIVVLGSSEYYIKTFSSNLYKSLRFIFVNHRGFSKTVKSLDNSAIELEHIIDDLEFVRNYLNLSNFILLGHSGHGYMALAYAKKYPQHLSHLILMNLSPYGGARNIEAANIYFQESICPERKALFDKNMRSLPEKIAANPNKAFIARMLAFGPMIWFTPDYDASTLWQDVPLIPEIIDYIWGKIFTQIDIANYTQDLDIPVLLILGRYDYWNPPHLWEAYRPFFSDLTMRIFERSGHSPQLEEPDNFEHEILSWLNSKK